MKSNYFPQTASFRQKVFRLSNLETCAARVVNCFRRFSPMWWTGWSNSSPKRTSSKEWFDHHSGQFAWGDGLQVITFSCTNRSFHFIRPKYIVRTQEPWLLIVSFLRCFFYFFILSVLTQKCKSVVWKISAERGGLTMIQTGSAKNDFKSSISRLELFLEQKKKRRKKQKATLPKI